MQVQDVMTRGVEVIGPDATLQQAAEIMNAMDVGPVPVCEGTRLVGVITDRDITVRATASGSDPNTTFVRDVMTPDILSVYEDQDVRDAARIMEQSQVRRLIVLDRDDEMAGIITLGDIALATEDEALTAQTLEGVSVPAEGVTAR